MSRHNLQPKGEQIMQQSISIDVINTDKHPISPKIIAILKQTGIETVNDLDGKHTSEIKLLFCEHPRWYTNLYSHLCRLGLVKYDNTIYVSKLAWQNFRWESLKREFAAK